MYRLALTKRNRALLRRYPEHSRESLRDCVMLQCADQRLTSRGYRKNHFVHYALPADRNLYFCHGLRGEDLLALGASASGTFGGIDYRSCEYPRYVEARHMRPALEGLTIASPAEQSMRPAASMLMCASLTREAFQVIGCEALFNEWERCALIEPDGGAERYRLSGVGSWLVREIIAEACTYSGRSA
ncbi:MAG: hypothetical protein NTW87_16190 [Planctomycetota bacterium]|nr:hypothetical protein [Planctomycetota bacterium]